MTTTVYGSNRRDRIVSGYDDDIVYAGKAKDNVGDYLMMNVPASDDIFYGGKGDDYLATMTGEDKLFGGKGDDYFMIFNSGYSTVVRGGEGDDYLDIKGSEDSFTIIFQEDDRVIYQRDDYTGQDYTFDVRNIEEINWLLD